MNERTRVERIGHRGAKRELPENTLAAFERAFDRGADAIELDVHATTDGVVVVHHDPTAHSSEGGLVILAAADWKTVQTVEFVGGMGIPKLADVLAATPDPATIYVEIKGKDIEMLVAATIRESRARCAVHSFDHDSIVQMAEIAPEIPRGVLFEDHIPDIARLLERTGARDVWPNWKLVDRDLVDQVHGANARVICWTVNDRATAEKLVALGVDALCGDDVRVFDGL